MICDFHLHTHHSDGKFAPAEVVDMAADAGIEALAVTDHDTLAGIAETRQRAEARGVAFVSGVEMTSYHRDRVVHVLGFGVSADDAGMTRANDTALQVWARNQRRWIESLAGEGFDVSFQRDFADGPVRLPELIARLCARGVEHGDPRRCHERFRRFFSSLPPHAYEPLPSPAAAAALIRQAGGLAILAHPSRLADEALAAALIEDLDGIECDYAAYDPGVRATLRELALRRGKLVSCGSDYHGYFDGSYVNHRFEGSPALLTRLGITRER